MTGEPSNFGNDDVLIYEIVHTLFQNHETTNINKHSDYETLQTEYQVIKQLDLEIKPFVDFAVH